MLTDKASKKVDSLMKELGDILNKEGCLLSSSNIKFNESCEACGTQAPIHFELNIEITGFMGLQ